MPTLLPRHSFGLRYIYLKFFASLLRIVQLAFIKWRTLRSHNIRIHDGVTLVCSTVPSRNEGRHIKVHIYRPLEYNDAKPVPVLINFHGSGFVIPSLGSDREFCSLVAARTGALVFDADYRKAPEHPFPAALQDAEDVAQYILSKPNQYDSSNIFTSGFSAGGNLALVTASCLGPERIKGVVSIYPPLDFTKPHVAPVNRMRSGITISPFVKSIFHGSYVLPGQPECDPRISPVLAPMETFPRFVYLTCGNADNLYDPCVRFVEKLKEIGRNDVVFVSVEYEGHAFDKMAKAGTESAEQKDRMYAGALEIINRALDVGK